MSVCSHICTHCLSHPVNNFNPASQVSRGPLGNSSNRFFFFSKWPCMALQNSRYLPNEWLLEESKSMALEPHLRYTREKGIPWDCWTKMVTSPEDHIPLKWSWCISWCEGRRAMCNNEKKNGCLEKQMFYSFCIIQNNSTFDGVMCPHQ